MTTLEQFMRDRYASLQRQRLELIAQLKVIQKEIDEIEKASRASGINYMETPPTQPRIFSERKSDKIQTMKEAAVHTLQEYPDGLSASEILPHVNKLLGTNYPRSSLSPQLSRLKHEGIIYFVDGIWKINLG